MLFPPRSESIRLHQEVKHTHILFDQLLHPRKISIHDRGEWQDVGSLARHTIGALFRTSDRVCLLEKPCQELLSPTVAAERNTEASYGVTSGWGYAMSATILEAIARFWKSVLWSGESLGRRGQRTDSDRFCLGTLWEYMHCICSRCNDLLVFFFLN